MKIVSRLIEEGKPVADDAEYLLELHKDRIKLEAIEKITMSVSELIYLMSLGMFIFACILVLSVATGIIVFQLTTGWIAGLTSAVGVFIVLSILLLTLGRKKIRDAIVAATVNAMYS